MIKSLQQTRSEALATSTIQDVDDILHELSSHNPWRQMDLINFWLDVRNDITIRDTKFSRAHTTPVGL